MGRTITLKSSLTWPDVKDDYVLRYEGHRIGRIRFASPVWEWHINIPMALPAWAQGTTANLDDARKAFATAWGRLLAQTSPDRLERAWDIERSAEARLRPAEAAASETPRAE
ncbi:MAG TPA: hypothetical protein VJR30_12255 [Bradyrhizobium sp.]|nr:hypothetical protein [Bradyrhizobium sp.]